MRNTNEDTGGFEIIHEDEEKPQKDRSMSEIEEVDSRDTWQMVNWRKSGRASYIVVIKTKTIEITRTA